MATVYKPLIALLERAMQGQGVHLKQVDINPEAVLKASGESPQSVVALYERKGDESWLVLARALREADPAIKIVVFGDGSDVGSVARGIACGISNYVPLTFGSDLLGIQRVIADAVAGKDPPADSVCGRVKAMLPVATGGEGSPYRSPSRKAFSAEQAIEQCISLGFTAEESARWLGVKKDAATRSANKVRRMPRGTHMALDGRLKVAGVIVLLGLAVTGLMGRRQGKRLVPVSGTLRLDGRPFGDAVVYFATEGGSHIASGKTDGEGRYQLSTLRQGDGAEEGSHVVWVGVPSRIREHIDMTDPQYTEKMVRLNEKMRAERESKEKDERAVPAAYKSKQSSPLRADVEGRNPMSLDFDLKP